MDKNLIMLEAKKELARREFFYFCHLTAPLFYKPEREFLVRLCNEMQSFYESDENALIINLPPRHGKSRTASMFVEWVLGRNQSEKIMTGSYNETLSTTPNLEELQHLSFYPPPIKNSLQIIFSYL